MLRKSSIPLSVLSVLLLITTHGLAQLRVLPTQPAAPPGDQTLGAMPAGQSLQFGITLPLRNMNTLRQLIQDLNNPASPQYGHFLTAQQFTEEFGPTADDYAKVITYAKAQGFTVTHTFNNRMLVRVSGTADLVNRTFHTSMRMYKHPTENRNYHAPSTEPSVDASVPILSVEGLSDRDLPHPMLKKATVLSDTTGSGASGQFLGSDMRAAYAPNSPYDGTGQTVGLVELGPYNESDVQAYFSSIGQPLNVPIYNVLLDVDGVCAGTAATGGCDDGEEVIDIEQAISMAPNLSGLIVYEAYGANSDALTAFTQAASDDTAKQLSLSFGFGGTPATMPGYEQVFMELEAQGQSLFIASGDSGANVGGVGYPGNSPNVIDVGGTDLTTAGPGGAWQGETAWVGSGGGWNTQSPIPSYQAPVISNANQGSTTFRNIPDVAAEANTDNYFCANGSCQTGIGGTSLAAPRWAGFLALANQQANGHSLPFLNRSFYTIGQSSSYSSIFHDITEGNDFNASSPNLFQAVPGYDLTTGWGTPDGQAMIDALAPPAVVSSGANFSLAASPASVAVTPGGTGTATVTLTPTDGFAGQVTLAVTPVGAPAGITAKLDTTTLSGTGQATVSIATTTGTPLGNQLLAVTGTSGGITQTTYIRLAIPDFSLQSAQATLYLNEGSQATDLLTVEPINGFTGNVALSVSGVPDGVRARLSQTDSSTTSTLSVQATGFADTSAGTELQVTGTADSTAHQVPALTLAVSAAAGDCGIGVPVDLSAAYNLSGLAADGQSFTGTGLDGDGFALSATLLTSSRVLSGVRFQIGSAGVPDAVFGAGQSIALPEGRYTTLQLLGTGINGNQTAQPLTVTYTDGTTTTLNQSFSDWFNPSINLSETEAVAMPYRDTATGGKDARQFNVYGYTLLLDSSKTVKSVTLPNNRNVVLLAATLTRQGLGVQANLASAFDATGIYADGATFPADGGLDGGGAAYSGNLLGDTKSGVSFVAGGLRFNLAQAGVPDALFGTGQTVPLPGGHFADLQLVGTAVQGDQTAQPVVVTYTDGSKQTFTQSFSDWSSFSGFPNEAISAKTAYRDLNDGTQNNQAFFIYRYRLALNPLKTVANITLPNNRNVLVLGITLDDQSLLQQIETLACHAYSSSTNSQAEVTH